MYTSFTVVSPVVTPDDVSRLNESTNVPLCIRLGDSSSPVNLILTNDEWDALALSVNRFRLNELMEQMGNCRVKFHDVDDDDDDDLIDDAADDRNTEWTFG